VSWGSAAGGVEDFQRVHVEGDMTLPDQGWG
jgi:hypothetical protein